MFTDITKLSFDGLHYGLHWSNVSYHWGSNGCCAEHGFNGTVQGSQTKLRRRQTSGLSLSSRRERSDWATPTGSGSDWSRPESVSPVSWRHTSWYPKDETSVVSCSLLPLLLKTAAALHHSLYQDNSNSCPENRWLHTRELQLTHFLGIWI